MMTGRGNSSHDAPKSFDAIHAGHLHIEGNDVRIEGRHLSESFVATSCGSDDSRAASEPTIARECSRA